MLTNTTSTTSAVAPARHPTKPKHASNTTTPGPSHDTLTPVGTGDVSSQVVRTTICADPATDLRRASHTVAWPTQQSVEWLPFFMMDVDGLILPGGLTSLIENGRWPEIPIGGVAAWAAGEDRLFLDTPPFHTVATEAALNPQFWDAPMAAPQGLDFDLAIVIGDFGPRSDAPVVLDYRLSEGPRVLRLRWAESGNEWVEVAASFDQFVVLLGLSM